MTAGDLHDRLAWIATLNCDALLNYGRADFTLWLRYALQAVQQVGGPMRQEQACCALLTFELGKEPVALMLTIKAPEKLEAPSMRCSRRSLRRGPAIERRLTPGRYPFGREGLLTRVGGPQ